MKLILLSGGSGRRLWPLSSDYRSKQFLKVLENDEGHYESMIQRVWRQLKKAELHRDAYIVANASQTEMLQYQLNEDVPIIVEPARKDTFPAISLAVLYLIDCVMIDPDETVCVLPVDSFVEDAFFHNLRVLERVLENRKVELALMGATPTYPSAKYGYILTGSQVDQYYWVETFVEKPTESVAVDLLEQRALWNCGIFAFRGRFLLDHLESIQLPTNYYTFTENYFKLEAISFDYSVVEHTRHIAVLPYKGDWKDLGTWNTLTEEIREPVIGRGSLSKDCDNTHVVNELNLPVKVLGISNAVIAVSSDGILVTDKASSPRLKEMLIDDKEHRTMYEERFWGWYRVLDDIVKEDHEIITRKIMIYESKAYTERILPSSIEVITIISGKCVLNLDGVQSTLGSGDTVRIFEKSTRILQALTETECIQVQHIHAFQVVK